MPIIANSSIVSGMNQTGVAREWRVDKYTIRKLASGSLGSAGEIAVFPESPATNYVELNKEAGLLHIAEQGSRLLHTD